MTDDPVGRLRAEYEARGLLESEMADDPFEQFDQWFAGVVEAGLHEPTAFVLATATPEGRPSARAVLMKDLSADGLVFYTNMESHKSRELKANPRAAATFVWTPLHRQVRLEGTAAELEPVVADAYFATRTLGAQIAAHASNQSRVVASRGELDERYEAFESEFADQDVPRPAFWSGWLLRIESVEFWQGQPNRFHDRVRYFKTGDLWSKERLAP